jgi:hypothetical protein
MTNYKPLDFWYDEQISRYFLQFMRIFSGFQWASGKDVNGARTLKRVPCRQGDVSRMVAYINKAQTENSALSVPFITCIISDITPDGARRQDPKFVSRFSVTEREFDESTGQYTSNIGVKAEIERFMPVPYEMKTEVNIWTSNYVQKMQLLEQIIILFNPALDIQSSTNALDWGALTYVELLDTKWETKSIPMGQDDPMSITTLNFKIPIWISPPAKVKKQHLIEQIIVNIGEMDNPDDLYDNNYATMFTSEQLLSRTIVTLDNAVIEVSGNSIILKHTDKNWSDYLKPFADTFIPNKSQLYLKPITQDIEDFTDDIVGTLNWDVSDPQKLIFNLDDLTLPTNTLNPITAIIDPTMTSPGYGLPLASSGQRYLLTNAIGPCQSWGNITAQANDIIEYNGVAWQIYFNAELTGQLTTPQYTINNISGKQLRWNGVQWSIIPDGEYGPGYWRIVL